MSIHIMACPTLIAGGEKKLSFNMPDTVAVFMASSKRAF
jgi:hypothetical protein